MTGFFGRGRAETVEPGRRDDAVQVLAALRDRRLHKRRTRDRIPAYLVVGPPGMGKSALIALAGLQLDRPLELESSNWWIGEDALFVEVTGAAPSDGSHPVLSLLRQLRPALPVSGIILVLSPADLTLADAAERVEMSGAIVRFLRAFEGRFRYAPPLYVAVSKLDLTPGFSEFFDRLEPAEREQPWGFTLPVELGQRLQPGAHRHSDGRKGEEPQPSEGDGKPTELVSAYRAGFRRLLEGIRGRVTQWISQETDPVQCARIVGFGAQVAALEAILKPIIEPLMPADDRRWPGAWLRGVYLTSTQQDALSIDVLLPDMAKRFALPRTGTLPPDLGLDDQALGYFVEGTFRRVILPEAGLAQQGNRDMSRAAIRGWTMSAAILILCLGLGIATALSYRDGIERIAGVNEAVAALGQTLSAQDPGALPAMLTGLDALAGLRAPDDAIPTVPVVSLDRYAQGLIARGSGELYTRALTNSLAPHLEHRLARDLVALDAPSETLRHALAAAVADRTDSSGAYRRWLEASGAGAALTPDARTALARHGAGAQQLHIVPAVGSAYTEVARGILEYRGEAP